MPRFFCIYYCRLSISYCSCHSLKAVSVSFREIYFKNILSETLAEHLYFGQLVNAKNLEMAKLGDETKSLPDIYSLSFSLNNQIS